MVKLISNERAREIVDEFSSLLQQTPDVYEGWDLFCETLKLFRIKHVLYAFVPFQDVPNYRKYAFQINNYGKDFNDWYIKGTPTSRTTPIDHDYLMHHGRTTGTTLIWSQPEDMEKWTDLQRNFEHICTEEYGIHEGVTFYPSCQFKGCFAGIGLSATDTSKSDWHQIYSAYKEHMETACSLFHQKAVFNYFARFTGLTDRQVQILQLLFEGKSRAKIEPIIKLSQSAVSKEVIRISEKLNCDLVDSEILSKAVRLGIVK